MEFKEFSWNLTFCVDFFFFGGIYVFLGFYFFWARNLLFFVLIFLFEQNFKEGEWNLRKLGGI